MNDSTSSASNPGEVVASISRRRLIGAGSVAIASSTLAWRAVTAQDASPAAEASPAPNAIGSDRFPVRTELGPIVPPEYDSETNWPSENLDLASTRNAGGSGITAATVGTLGLAWQHPVTANATYGALVAAPAIVGDTIYLQDALSNVTAFNKTTGEVIWENRYDEPVPSGGPNGVAVGYGHVVYTLGGPADVIAVKPDTGEELWRTNVIGFRNEGITIAPIIHDSTVYVSTVPGSVEQFYQGNQRGFLIAINLADGMVLWYMDTTTENLWADNGGNGRVNSGGGLWHPPSFDENGLLYAGIGNASPYPGIPEWPAASSRPGENNYANALMCIDPSTAGINWFINIKPHDLFDLDNQLSPILTTADIDGTTTNIVITSGKHGQVVAVNRESGSEIWRTPVGKHQNDDLQELTEEYVEVLPGTLGGVETPMALGDGVVIAPVYNLSTWYNQNGFDRERLDLGSASGQLVAMNVATGEIVWDVELPSGPLGGATVVNDVVFTAGLDGVVRGFATADGTQIFSWHTDAGVNASLAVSGDYLYIPAGGPLLPSVDTTGGSGQANIVALKLGGEAQSLATPRAEEATPVAEAPAETGGNAVTVEATEFAYSPNEFEIPANTDVVITLVNKGVAQHDLAIDALGLKTDLLDGGATGTITVHAAAGTYEFICTVAGHAQLGMVGTLTVK